MNDVENEVRPKLEIWKEVVPWLIKMLLIFLVVLLSLCAIKKAFVHLGFLVSFERVFASVSSVAAAWAWPCCVLIVIYLFKGNLKGLAGVVGCIRNGKDVFSPSNEEDEDRTSIIQNQVIIKTQVPIKNDATAISCDQIKQNGLKPDKLNKDPMGKLVEHMKDMTLFKSYALNRLQREIQVLVFRNVRIFKAGTFDGSFQIRNVVYGVKVMWKPTQTTIDNYLGNLERVYLSLTEPQKAAFRILLCINDCGVDVGSVVKAYERLKCTAPVEYRVYSYDPNKIILSNGMTLQGKEGNI